MTLVLFVCEWSCLCELTHVFVLHVQGIAADGDGVNRRIYVDSDSVEQLRSFFVEVSTPRKMLFLFSPFFIIILKTFFFFGFSFDKRRSMKRYLFTIKCFLIVHAFVAVGCVLSEFD